ncbi:MAG TPA: hypothetical protein PKA63_14245, partial [Oligoflexia bacterium]|nr:hypothetical protein [Oligoflexia bacterium]
MAKRKKKKSAMVQATPVSTASGRVEVGLALPELGEQVQCESADIDHKSVDLHVANSTGHQAGADISSQVVKKSVEPSNTKTEVSEKIESSTWKQARQLSLSPDYVAPLVETSRPDKVNLSSADSAGKVQDDNDLGDIASGIDVNT